MLDVGYWFYSPWHSSCSHQPWSGGTGPGRPSWNRLWEAIIEKNSQRCSISKERLWTEALLPSARLKPSHSRCTECRRWTFWGHHCSVLARIATSRGIQLGFQGNLTMVSIDGEVNEELSRSLSLAKEILQVKLDCEMVEVGFRAREWSVPSAV